MHTHKHTHTKRERERERERQTDRQRVEEREREGERDSLYTHVGVWSHDASVGHEEVEEKGNEREGGGMEEYEGEEEVQTQMLRCQFLDKLQVTTVRLHTQVASR